MSNLLENADVSNSQFPNYLGFKLLSRKNSPLVELCGVEQNNFEHNIFSILSFLVF